MKSNTTRKHKTIRRRKSIKSSGGMKPVSKLSANARNYVPSKPKLSANARNYIPTSVYFENNANNANNANNMENEIRIMSYKIENAVAIDCEMVGVGDFNDSGLAHVAIVDFNGKKIYDKYVIPKGGIESITDYRTKFSGITPEKLVDLDKDTHSYETVKREVHHILDGKTIVGHGLINDFRVLEFTPEPETVWDTTEIDMYMKNHPSFGRSARRLKEISKEFANNNIQSNMKSGHSPLEDARASMNLYRMYFDYDKIRYENMSK